MRAHNTTQGAVYPFSYLSRAPQHFSSEKFDEENPLVLILQDLTEGTS